MYTKAKQILGFWSIMLVSTPNGVVQFKSLSRKLANEWAQANEPMPAAYVLNATTGNTVWRYRQGTTQ